MLSSKIGLCLAMISASTVVGVPALAQDASNSAGPFAATRMRLGVGAGSGSFAGDRSVILGASFGYFVLDGLEVGVEGDFWTGGSNTLGRLSPSVTYVFWQIPVVRPYGGVFYRHWFIGSPFQDLDTLGFRVGGYHSTRGGSYFGGGIAYERQVSPECPANGDCTYIYPELRLAFVL